MSSMPMALALKHYHIFLASPQDMQPEREVVHKSLEQFNRFASRLWGVRFDVLTCDDVGAGGVEERYPERHVIKQTMQRYKKSLVLFVGLMGKRYGSPTGGYDSGTEEEFEWAREHAREHKPFEIKFFFPNVVTFEASGFPSGSGDDVLDQWRLAWEFRKKVSESCVTKTYDAGRFAEVFSADLLAWLFVSERPWIKRARSSPTAASGKTTPPTVAEVGQTLRNRYSPFRESKLPPSVPYVRPSIRWRGRVIDDTDLFRERKREDTANRPFVVISPPGAGKSLLLANLGLLARRESPESLPILINLGTIHGSDFDNWPRNLLRTYLREAERRLVDRHFAEGKAYLFLDGLDEFAVGNKDRVPLLVDRCIKLARRGIRLTLACRSWYWLHSAMREDFEVAELQEFNSAQALELLGPCSARLPEDAFDEDMDTGERKLKPWVLNPKVLSFIRASEGRFGSKTDVFANWAAKVARTELPTRFPKRKLTAAQVLDFFGDLAIFLTRERVRAVRRREWRRVMVSLRYSTAHLSYDQANDFGFLTTTRTGFTRGGEADTTKGSAEESVAFSHALVWEYFAAYRLAQDFRRVLSVKTANQCKQLALASTALDFVPSSVFGFLSETLGPGYLLRLLAWLRRSSLAQFPPRLVFNLIEYVSKTAQGTVAKAVPTLLRILHDDRLDRAVVKGDPATLVRYNAARALERLHAGAPQPYFDWSSDWGVADWSKWKSGVVTWGTWAIRGARLSERKPDTTPRMDINFDLAATADMPLQRKVCGVLMQILKNTTDPFLSINCSHALIRWYDFTDQKLDSELDELSNAASDTSVHANLSRWVKKAAWYLR